MGESLVKRVLLAHDFDSGFCTIPGVLFFRLKEAFKSQWPIIPSSNFLVENIDLKRNEDDFEVTSSHQSISKSLFNLDKSVVIIKESDNKGDSTSESNSTDDNDYDVNIEEDGDSVSMISKGKEEEKGKAEGDEKPPPCCCEDANQIKYQLIISMLEFFDPYLPKEEKRQDEGISKETEIISIIIYAVEYILFTHIYSIVFSRLKQEKLNQSRKISEQEKRQRISFSRWRSR